VYQPLVYGYWILLELQEYFDQVTYHSGAWEARPTLMRTTQAGMR
jgi:hypothetical protein